MHALAYDPTAVTYLHPLAELLVATAQGRFVPPDGGWRRLPIWRRGLEAIVALTGHAVFCVDDDISDAQIDALGADGLGGAHDPRLVAALAGHDAWVSCIDAVLVRAGTGTREEPADTPTLVARPDLAHEPRSRYAAALRDELVVLGLADPARRAVVTVGRGLAGLYEVSMELEADRRGMGEGRSIASELPTLVPMGTPVVACVAPGNAASLRAFLAAQFVPVGSVQLFRRRTAPGSAACSQRGKGPTGSNPRSV